MSAWRGHRIAKRFDGVWRYVDTGEIVADNPGRACGRCGAENTPEGHDACWGALPGVRNACCGHGDPADAYVQLDNGTRHSGRDAFAWVEAQRPSDTRHSSSDPCFWDSLDPGHPMSMYPSPTYEQETRAEVWLGAVFFLGLFIAVATSQCEAPEPTPAAAHAPRETAP